MDTSVDVQNFFAIYAVNVLKRWRIVECDEHSDASQAETGLGTAVIDAIRPFAKLVTGEQLQKLKAQLGLDPQVIPAGVIIRHVRIGLREHVAAKLISVDTQRIFELTPQFSVTTAKQIFEPIEFFIQMRITNLQSYPVVVIRGR